MLRFHVPTFARQRACRTGPALAVLGALLLGLLGVRPVAAHAFLDHSDPPANAVLATPPQQVTLWFTERLEFAESSATLDDQQGKPVSGATSRPGSAPTELVLTLPNHLPTGTYSVIWQTMSAVDGHVTNGSFAFTVGTAANVQPVIPPASIGPSGPPEWLQMAGRWLAYLGLMATVALWPIWLLVLRPALGAGAASDPPLIRHLRRLVIAALALALLGDVTALLVQADAGAGSFAHALWVTLRDTRYGQLWLVRIGLLLADAAALACVDWAAPWRRKGAAVAALVLATALPVPFSLNAHAAAQTTGRTTAITADLLHLLAASVWAGGLFLLAGALLPVLRRASIPARRAILLRAIPRFSVVALTAWGVLGLTGLYSAWLQVGNWAGLRTTAYGHSLTIKVLLLLPLLGLGAFNLLIVTRRLRAAKEVGVARAWSRHFMVAVSTEVVLVVLVLLVVGRLTSQAPAREVLASRTAQVVLSLQAQGRTATLAVAPATPGPNGYRLDVTGPPLPANATALLRVSLPSQNTGQTDIPLHRLAGNTFATQTSALSIVGAWSVEAIIRVPNQAEWTATTTLPIAARPAAPPVPGTAWHFGPGGVAGLLLVLLGLAGVALAWVVTRQPARWRDALGGMLALALGAIVLLGARTAPSTPTTTRQTTPVAATGALLTQVNLVVPAAGPPLHPSLSVQLEMAPVRPGANTVTVRVLDANGRLLPARQTARVGLAFTSLDHAAVPATAVAAPTAAGFVANDIRLGQDGWWRINVTIVRPGQPDLQVPFYLILPDPNVNGFAAAPVPPSDPAAAAVFRRGLQGLTSLHRVRFTQWTSGGTGTQVTAIYAVSDGSNGRPPASFQELSTYQQITVGTKLWSRKSGGTWTEGAAPPLFLPKDWAAQYRGATGFRLGPIETIGGEPCQIVTFAVPATQQYQAAWYVWWVGLNDGRVRQETLIAKQHYMVTIYSDFDGNFTITPPRT